MDYPTKCHLIKLVEEEESIWNTGIEDYARLDKKNESWNRIYKEMTTNYNFCGSMLELKTTWKNLRDQWRKNSLNKASGNSKSWTFEKHLLFLATAQNEANKKESAVRRWLATVFGDTMPATSKSITNNKSSLRMDVSMKKELIALIRQEELLWNPECKDYYRLDKKNLIWSKILAKLEKKGYQGGCEVQFSPHVESDSKLHSMVDSPHSSATPDDAVEEAASIASVAASDEVNESYFVPVSEAQENGSASNDVEPLRKRSYGGGFAAKRRKMDSLQEGLDMIREITASLRERLSSASMDKYDRYGAFIASSLREMSEPAAKRKMTQLMDCLLNQGSRT
ncbi:hypothetical protein DICVIV_03267 [Dictyocaulus viviparus]|uniref:MADF domain-containing protein n=1 Tax=Dictyocaulus viviparus TaxID=29172 RepID=A0A0D8Y150_DICVI|nr:hypothetical protein DICVIV_03267 [Dictyocaulus viviparus]